MHQKNPPLCTFPNDSRFVFHTTTAFCEKNLSAHIFLKNDDHIYKKIAQYEPKSLKLSCIALNLKQTSFVLNLNQPHHKTRSYITATDTYMQKQIQLPTFLDTQFTTTTCFDYKYQITILVNNKGGPFVRTQRGGMYRFQDTKQL